MTEIEKTEGKKISPQALRRSFWNWFFWNGCSQQAESMLGMAFGQAMAPVVEDLYDTKEEKAAALKRHISLFNTEAQVGSICNGIVCGLEESNANGKCTPEVIESPNDFPALEPVSPNSEQILPAKPSMDGMSVMHAEPTLVAPLAIPSS